MHRGRIVLLAATIFGTVATDFLSSEAAATASQRQDLDPQTRSLVFRAAYNLRVTFDSEREFGDAQIASFRRQADSLRAVLTARTRELTSARTQVRRNAQRIQQLEREVAQLRDQLGRIAEEVVTALAQRDEHYRRIIALSLAHNEALLETANGRRALELIAAGGNDNREEAASILELEVAAQDEADRLRRAARHRSFAYTMLSLRGSGSTTTTARMISAFEDIVRDDPSQSNDWIELAGLYRENLDLVAATRAAGRALDTSATDAERATALTELGDIFFAQGRFGDAQHSHDEVLLIDQRLAVAQPGATAPQEALAIALDRLGDLSLARPNGRGAALDYYERARRIRGELAAREPGSVSRERAVLVSLNRIGFAHFTANRLDDAARAYEAGLAIARRLAADPSTPSGARQDLAISLDRIGDLHLKRGDATSADRAFEESARIWQDLLALDPDSVALRRTYALSLIRRADAAEERDPRRVQTLLNDALQQNEALARLVPGTPSLDRDMSVLLQRLGDSSVANSNRASAVAYYRRGLEIDRRLAALNPDAASHQRDIVVSLVRLAEMEAPGFTWAQALAQFERIEAAGALEPADAEIYAEVRRRAEREVAR
jgi:tetratricopeptide (TPR) repeat protein